ncbi:MAG: glycosyltransferase family 39 protein, partial [Chloroflexota bacterium]
PEWLAGYPPLYVWFNIGVQQTVETFWTRPWILISDYMFYLRLLSAAMGVTTALLMMRIGWQLAGSVAGWLAGLAWALSPIIVEHNSLAVPDPLLYLACAVSITMALQAWKLESGRWLLGSLIAAIAAIYLKYSAVYALIPPGIVLLILLYRQPRRMLPWLIAMLVVGGAAGAYLIFGYGSFRLTNREADTVRDSFIDNLLDPDRNFNNWYFAIYPIGMTLFAISGIGGLAAYAYSRAKKWQIVNMGPVLLLLLYGIAAIMLTSTFTSVWLGAGKIRHVLPTTVAVMALWGAAVAQIIWTAKSWLQDSRPKMSQTWLATAGILALVGVFTLPGMVSGDGVLVARFQHISVQQQLWHWTDVNIPTDGMILGNPGSWVAHSWNRPWSGYDGVKTFLWWTEDADQIAASSPQAYVERGITYFVTDARDLDRYYKAPALKKFISQLTLVKTFHIAADQTDENQFDTYFYRMLPPQHAADALFGGQIDLTGYDLSAETVKAGDTLTFRPYFRAPRRPDTNYSMFVHLYPADEDRVLAQHDGAPTVIERPTLTWDDPDELYIGADVNLAIPADTPPGDYRVVIGLYDYSNGARLTLPDGVDKFTIPITIQ